MITHIISHISNIRGGRGKKKKKEGTQSIIVILNNSFPGGKKERKKRRERKFCRMRTAWSFAKFAGEKER